MVKLSSLFNLGKKAVEKIDEKTIDKVAKTVKGIDPGTVDKVAGQAGKVVGQKRAQSVADKAKGLLKDDNIDAVASKAKGFVGKDDKPRQRWPLKAIRRRPSHAARPIDPSSGLPLDLPGLDATQAIVSLPER